jgi:hypothetical protein
MNIKTKTLYERYLKMVPERVAFIMACVEGGQEELAQPVIEQERTDQEILMRETYECLVPRQELYPEVVPYDPMRYIQQDVTPEEEEK